MRVDLCCRHPAQRHMFVIGPGSHLCNERQCAENRRGTRSRVVPDCREDIWCTCKGTFAGYMTQPGILTHSQMRAAAGRGTAPIASSSKTTLDAAKKEQPPTKAPPQTVPKQPILKAKASVPDTKESITAAKNSVQKTEMKEKPKPSGKLDWSKAKTKDKVKASGKPKDEPDRESSSSKNVSADKPPAPIPSRPSVEAASSSKLRQIKPSADSAKPCVAPAQVRPLASDLATATLTVV